METCAVVVTYNRKKLLGECINALLEQSVELKKIVIIDNNSNDGTEEFLRENKFIDNKKIDYVKLDENIGGAGGFNSGIKTAMKENYDWIWIMDDDTIPTNNALENLLKSSDVIEENNSFLCSKVIGMDGEEMNIPNISNRNGENGYPIWMKYLNNGIVEVKSATFVSVLIKSEAIKKVGFPWKEFFIWGDDIEYTSRLSKYFGPGFVVGNSIVIHKRFGGKNISIIEEENINRINFYKYKYRNDILIARAYGKAKDRIRIILRSVKDIKNILLHSKKYKLKKVGIIINSVSNGLFNIGLNKSFNNRMKCE